MIKNAFADFYMTYKDWINSSNNRAESKNLCKIWWYIQSLSRDYIKWNVSAISDFKIIVYSFWDVKKFEITSMWVINNLQLENFNKNWLLTPINWKIYNPQLWDYIIAKVNSENNYINELYLWTWKDIEELDKISKNISLPYCKWEFISEKKQTNSEIWNIQVLFSLIIFFLIIIILILIFKIYKSKK